MPLFGSSPRPLQLPSADEITAMENLDILAANGFGLSVDEDAPYGRGERIRLTAMPTSKETVFDEKGILTIRPSNVIAEPLLGLQISKS